VTDAVAHGEQVEAFIDWSSTREGKTIEGKEIAVYRIRDARIVEATSIKTTSATTRSSGLRATPAPNAAPPYPPHSIPAPDLKPL
jgi:hypothetical protein